MSDSWDAWCAVYLSHLQVRFPRSVESVRYGLRYFVLWCRDRGLEEPLFVDSQALQAYQRWLFFYRKPDGTRLTTGTQIHRLSYVRGFFRWLKDSGKILSNPAQSLRLPRQPRALPKSIFSLEQVCAVLEAVPLDRPMGLRDRAILETFFATGLRRQELLGLRLEDLRAEQLELFIGNGKGGKQRLVPLGRRALAWIERYLEELRPKHLKGKDQGWLFIGKYGKQLSVSTLTAMAHSHVSAAGLEGKGACHVFRHSMATMMLEGGADIWIR